MKLNKKHIPYLAASIQTAQFGFAGYILAGYAGAFFLGIMGALVSIVVSYGSSQLDVASSRKGRSIAAMIAIMCFSPILVGTATWIHLTIISNVYWRGVVSLAWGALSDLSPVLAGFVAGKGLFDVVKKPKKSKKVAGKGSKKTKPLPQVARKKIADNELLAFLQENPGASQQKVADNFGVTRQAIGPRVKKLYEVK